jgi:hypothetical protein
LPGCLPALGTLLQLGSLAKVSRYGGVYREGSKRIKTRPPWVCFNNNWENKFFFQKMQETLDSPWLPRAKGYANQRWRKLTKHLPKQDMQCIHKAVCACCSCTGSGDTLLQSSVNTMRIIRAQKGRLVFGFILAAGQAPSTAATHGSSPASFAAIADEAMHLRFAALSRSARPRFVPRCFPGNHSGPGSTLAKNSCSEPFSRCPPPTLVTRSAFQDNFGCSPWISLWKSR